MSPVSSPPTSPMASPPPGQQYIYPAPVQSPQQEYVNPVPMGSPPPGQQQYQYPAQQQYVPPGGIAASPPQQMYMAPPTQQPEAVSPIEAPGGQPWEQRRA